MEVGQRRYSTFVSEREMQSHAMHVTSPNAVLDNAGYEDQDKIKTTTDIKMRSVVYHIWSMKRGRKRYILKWPNCSAPESWIIDTRKV
jgi:hypothetical protein